MSCESLPELSLVSCRQDLVRGLEEVQHAELYDVGSSNSHVDEILRQVKGDGLRSRDREVTDLWLARTPEHQAVAMALVTHERFTPVMAPVFVLNLFVAYSHRRQGLGDRLVQAALAAHPMLEGHYTHDSLALYRRHALPDVYRHSLPSNVNVQDALAKRHADLEHPSPWPDKVPVWRVLAADHQPRAHRQNRRRDRSRR